MSSRGAGPQAVTAGVDDERVFEVVEGDSEPRDPGAGLKMQRLNVGAGFWHAGQGIWLKKKRLGRNGTGWRDLVFGLTPRAPSNDLDASEGGLSGARYSHTSGPRIGVRPDQPRPIDVAGRICRLPDQALRHVPVA